MGCSHKTYRSDSSLGVGEILHCMECGKRLHERVEPDDELIKAIIGLRPGDAQEGSSWDWRRAILAKRFTRRTLTAQPPSSPESRPQP